MRLIAFMLISNLCFSQIAHDKKQHYAAGVFTSSVAYAYVYTKTKNKKKAVIYSVISAVVVGSLKEAVDSRQPGNKFDPQDLLATTLGGITVGVTIQLFNKKK
tara:strand:- start:225 stop:533 length:309 start_codon:yes stop_codon:yes gene_type:complete